MAPPAESSPPSRHGKMDQLQLNHGRFGEKRLLSEGAFSEMWEPHISNPAIRVVEVLYPSTHFLAYGLGWNLMDYRGRKVVSHSGASDGMFSRVALVPEENLGMVILTNSATGIGMALMYQILDAYLDGPERDWSKVSLERELAGRRQFVERIEAIEKSRITCHSPSLPLEAYSRRRHGGPMYGDAKVTVDAGSLVSATTSCARADWRLRGTCTTTRSLSSGATDFRGLGRAPSSSYWMARMR